MKKWQIEKFNEAGLSRYINFLIIIIIILTILTFIIGDQL